MKTKATKKLVASLVAMVVCFSMLIGTTFAWFTDSTSSGSNVITAGNLDINVEYTLDGENWSDLEGATDLFQKGEWEPGHTEVVALKIANQGSLALKYKANMKILDEKTGINENGEQITLSEILKISTLVQQANEIGDIALMVAFMGENSVAYENTSKLSEGLNLRSDVELFSGDAHYLIIKIDMPETVGNEANNNGVDIPEIEFGIDVVATQYTYENDTFGDKYDSEATYPPDTWNGKYSIAWFLKNPEADEFILSTAEDFAGLAKLVDRDVDSELPQNITLPVNFEGKTIKLDTDLDLYLEDENGEPVCFDPIGSYRKDLVFKGTFDGQGHTISNLYQNTWALDNGYYYGDLGLGLFGAVQSAHIKDLVIDGADVSGESALCGTIVAVAEDTTFENITVKNAGVADYQYYSGGIVGWASGEVNVINCNIDASTTIGGQWGDFNNANGGVIGGASTSATIKLKDCTIACRIDAFNDVTSAYEWYSYRRSGMIIGDTGSIDDPDGDNVGNATAPQLECENVTVIYGDWANYHYCQFKNMGYPWVRVEAGTSTGVYSNPRYGHPTDANGNEVVDDNHVHNDGEKHNELIVFDQLYGGESGHRYCTYGTATHPGVTVIYNNK